VVGPALGTVAETVMAVSESQKQVKAAKKAAQLQSQQLGQAIPLVPAVATNNPGVGVTAQPAYAPVDSEVARAARDFRETAHAFGFRQGLIMLKQRYPEIFALFEVMADLVTVTDSAELWVPEDEVAYYRAPADGLCSGCGARSSDFSGNLPIGEFYRSNLLTARVSRDLGHNVFGEIRLSSLPFPIQVSGQTSDPRARIALAHEVVHAADRLLKIGMSHDQVHHMGVLMATEGLPLLKAYERHIGNQYSLN